MLQCSECEFCKRGPGGQLQFSCDPFSNIKEPECLAKWHLLKLAEQSDKLDRLVAAYEATVAMYRKLAPLQEKMFRHMEREIEDVEEADKWKYEEEGEEDDEADDAAETDDTGEDDEDSKR